MSRKPRIHIPGGVYHVMLRGNGGQSIFPDAFDGARFLELLAEGTERFGFCCHGYCLMPNHVHLVLRAGAVPLSRAMQNLSFRYGRYVNGREKRIGHLFQGRYKAILVDGDAYLLELVRYVHLNPVRAGLADKPEAWRWSGHRAYLGRAAAPWLATDWVLSQFAPREADARAAYRAFVADGMGGGRRPEFHAGNGGGGRLLGDDDFIERALAEAEAEAKSARRPSPDAIIEAVAAACGVTAAALRDRSRARHLAQARGLAGLIARETGAAPLSAMAARFGRDQSSYSRAVARVAERLATNEDLGKWAEAANKAIMHD
jgi:REP element-mobilizing transposase RayT